MVTTTDDKDRELAKLREEIAQLKGALVKGITGTPRLDRSDKCVAWSVAVVVLVGGR